MNGSRPAVALLAAVLATTGARTTDGDPAFPGEVWDRKEPAQCGMDQAGLDEFARSLGGRGCVVKDGYVVFSWGSQSEKSDLYSSVKPLFGTLLFFAIEEGRVTGVDQQVAEFGWALEGKDRGITFRHLADMTSGYARPEGPGRAWAYNDFAIQLYQQTLFDRVFQDDPARVVMSPERLGPLQFQDGIEFTAKRRLKASVRDFARLAWFWTNKGRWGERQLLPVSYFETHMRPDVPPDLPHTAEAETVDTLGIGSFGGGSDHFADDGPGIYGFNWWFNARGLRHPDQCTWPDAPADTVMSLGFGGNHSVMIPSLGLVAVTAQGDWGKLEAGHAGSKMNRMLALLAAACDPE